MASYEILKLIANAGDYRLADIAIRLASKNEGMFLALAAEAGCDVPALPITVGLDTYAILPHQLAAMREAYLQQYAGGGGYNKVAAIKVAREVMGPAPGKILGLKEAKDLVEALMSDGHLPVHPTVGSSYSVDHDPNGRPYSETGVSLGQLLRDQVDPNDPLRPRY
jgi:hypothetical protein